jgi:hypothetical protein
MQDDAGYYGVQRPEDASGEYNALAFVINQILNGKNFCAWVQVVNVDAPGGLALAGTVDVKPLVNQLDGLGQPVPHGVVNDLPYLRAQGGTNAIIMDPKVGDIGLCVFADRDSSSAQASRGVANPGSFRRNDMADGVYLGGILNVVPTQYAMFTDDGISIVSPTKITMQAPEIDLVAPVIDMHASTSVTVTTPTFTVNGNAHVTGTSALDGAVTAGSTVDATGNITAPVVNGTTNVTFGGKSGLTHHHSGVQTGTGQTGGVV